MRHNIEVSFFTTIFPLNLTALPPGPLSHEKLKKGEGETEEILITENPLLSSEINGRGSRQDFALPSADRTSEKRSACALARVRL